MKNSKITLSHARASTLPSSEICPPVFTTMGKDTSHWSFCKADRFSKDRHTKYPSYFILPSTLEKRSTSFGYGKRWEPFNPKGRDSPSPDTYSINTSFNLLEKKGYSMKGKVDSSKFKISNDPGPGAYDPYNFSPIGADGPKFSFRPKIIRKIKNFTPDPGAYSPSFKLKEKGNYSNIGFGKEKRNKNLSFQRIESPGPGAYDIPGTFNKSLYDLSSRSRIISRPVTRN
ncbi:unnamed protein product [Blepharisma stoltei]|uniref:Uncharacterized protein n=1 Tax=Blepharisma stoltei TaxID=1481888 RepID=A0AAU9INA4_9CILI|nr:unnamed protein product [Blepharisma stoltei]